MELTGKKTYKEFKAELDKEMLAAATASAGLVICLE